MEEEVAQAEVVERGMVGPAMAAVLVAAALAMGREMAAVSAVDKRVKAVAGWPAAAMEMD
jgi:hypothetical protein